jgi:hypothetical protein
VYITMSVGQSLTTSDTQNLEATPHRTSEPPAFVSSVSVDPASIRKVLAHSLCN